MTQHPITPPIELVQQWDREWREQQNAPVIGWSANLLAYVATRAAQWGADQELEACVDWMKRMGYWGDDGKAIPALRAARRPKPPSLKEQALAALTLLCKGPDATAFVTCRDTIRRALEQLDD